MLNLSGSGLFVSPSRPPQRGESVRVSFRDGERRFGARQLQWVVARHLKSDRRLTDRRDVQTQPCQTAGNVEEMMTPDPICVGPDTPVAEVWRTMSERRFRHMPVVDEDGKLIGMVSQRDLIVAAPAGAEAEQPVSKLMRTELDTVCVACCAAQAARHMLRSKRSCLPVVDAEHKLIGILTEADYLRLATRGAPPCTCAGVATGTAASAISRSSVT